MSLRFARYFSGVGFAVQSNRMHDSHMALLVFRNSHVETQQQFPLWR